MLLLLLARYVFALFRTSVGLLLPAGLFLFAAQASVAAQEEGRQVTIGQAVELALKQSQLTVAGGAPFHLKAHIAAAGKSAPQYTADVEEYWMSPEQWRRKVKSADFSQTLVANGGNLSETLTGDYYPFWLRNMITAIFDPLPMAEQLKRMHTQLAIPEDSLKSNSCLSMQSKVGVAPAQSTVSYAFCFGGKLGLLKAAITPGYRAQFSDYQPFQGKLVARNITAEFAPGLTISANISELGKLANPDESQFLVEKPTPPAEQMKSSQVGEDSARVLALNTPAVVWPAVREGSTAGMLNLYISTDRTGHVREAWPLNSGNPPLNDAAREQVLHWQYRPYVNGGVTQMEAVLTFAFNTRIENPVPVLTGAQARKQAVRMVEPVIAPGKARKGTKFTLRASVDESGKVQGVQNTAKVSPVLYAAGSAALKKWRFRVYTNKGKPDRFYADIVFMVH